MSGFFLYGGGGGVTREKTNHINIDFCHLFGVTFKNEKWPRNGSPGHGFECRPLNWLSFFAENPFLATPGPETPRKNPKFSKIFQNSQVDYNCVKITTDRVAIGRIRTILRCSKAGLLGHSLAKSRPQAAPKNRHFPYSIYCLKKT